MNKLVTDRWLPTPTFLYRNYLYNKQVSNIPNSKYFLDIGPGNGLFLENLSLKGFSGEAVDISKKAVETIEGSTNLSNRVTVCQCDFMKISAEKKYDVIFCFEVLEHLRDDEAALRKIKKLMKPGGQFMFSIPAHMKLWTKIDEEKGHFRRYEKKEIQDKLDKLDLKIELIYTYGFPFCFFLRFLRNRIISKVKNNKTSKLDRTKVSGLTKEYSFRYKGLINNKHLLMPFFWIMDLFVETDWGLGYFVVAKKI